MKYTSYLYGLLMLAWTMTGCTAEKLPQPGGEEGQPVLITIQVGTSEESATRATDPGSGIDSRIEKLRILGYRTSDGVLAFNKTLDVNANGSTPNSGVIKGTIEIPVGRYDFVFIANEDSDPSLPTGGLNGAATASKGLLENLSFSQAAFASDRPIPMVTMIENVDVIDEDTIQTPSETITNTAWKVPIERLGVRIDLTVEMSANFSSGAVLSFERVPNQVFLIQKANAIPTATATTTRTITATPTTTTTANGVKKTWERIILPESWFTPVNTAANGVQLCMTNGSDKKTAALGVNPKTNTDFTLPRNHYFAIKGTVVDNEAQLTMEIAMKNWVNGDVNDSEGIGTRELRVSSLTAKKGDRVWFWTDQTKASIEANTVAGVSVSSIFTGLPGGANFSFNASTGAGYFDIASSSTGTHSLILNANGHRRTINVTL